MDTASVIESDDAAFVDSVMSSQSDVAVENVICTQNTPNYTPSADTRKRHLSTDSEDELPTKRGPGAQKSRDNQDLFELMTAGFLELKRDLASTLDSKFQDFESRLTLPPAYLSCEFAFHVRFQRIVRALSLNCV